MVHQLFLNFDATGFDGFDSTREFFAHCSRTLKDEEGRTFKQAYQAAEMDMSPPQWSNKLNETNNTTVTLNDADEYTEIFNDVRWIYFAFHKHVILKGDVAEMEKLRDQLDARITKAKRKKR